MRRGDPEPEKMYFRSETRVFHLNGDWYFCTREGDQGPFPRREVAIQEAQRYANERASLEDFQASRSQEVTPKPRTVQPTLSLVPLEKETGAEPVPTLALEAVD